MAKRNWMTQALALFRPERKSNSLYNLVALQGQGRAIWTPRNYREFAEEGYMKNAIAFRCVRMIAEGAASVPLDLFEGDRKLSAHPLLDLLKAPNKGECGRAWAERIYGFLQVAGNAYIEAVVVSGRLRELHVLRPDRMKVIVGDGGWPEAYEYSFDGGTILYQRDNVSGFLPIAHLKQFHPTNDHYGMSPIEAAAFSIDIHNAAADWNKALLDNGARPSGALIYKGVDGSSNLTPDQVMRLKAELETTYQGSGNAGRPMLLEGGLDWKPLSLTPSEMDFINAKHVAAREIALAFGVPPMLLGIPGDNTYSNYQEANSALWRQVIIPLVEKTAEALSQWLQPVAGAALQLKPNLDEISQLSLERERKWNRIGAAGFLDEDEKRALLGFPRRTPTASRRGAQP